ncbi:MAG: hypothetical protein Ct9H90mP21_2670 [Methanobacteriota archaeon]|nr:MAG: hypothetical protein Ct9H90mP21_2670 [Euryarchaeota archaeon]
MIDSGTDFSLRSSRNSCEEGMTTTPAMIFQRNATSQRSPKVHDWRVGHGLVDTDRALALSRTLQVMRDPDEEVS